MHFQRAIPAINIFEQNRRRYLGQVPAAPSAPSATLKQIREMAKEIRDNRALLAQAFQKFAETGDQSWNQKVSEYDGKVLDLVTKAKALVPTLPELEQPVAMDLINGNFDPKMGSRFMGQTAPAPTTPPVSTTPAPMPAAPATPVATPAPAAGVVCRPTAEGGQVCSNGTCIAPGANAPVTAAEAPASFPILPVAIGAGAATLFGAVWYLIATRK